MVLASKHVRHRSREEQREGDELGRQGDASDYGQGDVQAVAGMPNQPQADNTRKSEVQNIRITSTV